MYQLKCTVTTYGPEDGDEFIRPELSSQTTIEDFEFLGDMVTWVNRRHVIDDITGNREYGYASEFCAVVGTEHNYDGTITEHYLRFPDMHPAKRGDVIEAIADTVGIAYLQPA